MSVARLQLEEIAESVSYGVTASASDEPVGPKFLRITDIQEGKVNWNEVPWCDGGAKSTEAAKLRRGDIVFARTGATTGKSFLIGDCPENAVFASYLIRVRLSDAADPNYVSHFFQTADYWGQITKSARGVAQPGVNATTLKALQVPLPSLPEQKRIAGILDAADALRAKRRESIAQLDTLLQSTFLDMFGDPVTNPMGWEVVPITEAVDGKYGIKAGPFGSALKKEDYVASGFRVYGQEQVIAGRFDVGDYYIDERKYKKLGNCAVTAGDILVSLVGSYGKVLIVPDGIEPGIINPRLLKITPRQELVTSLYLATLIQNDATQRKLESMSHGGTMGILNAGLLKQLTVPTPSLHLQHRFAAIVESIEQQKASQRAHLDELNTLFASLQSRAFRGVL